MTDAVDRGESSAAELAEAALRHPAVVRLHRGRYGEVGTYLPGRRIPGVRVTVDEVEIHIVVALGVPVRRVADEVRASVRPLVGAQPVHVVVGDLADPADIADKSNTSDVPDLAGSLDRADAADAADRADPASSAAPGSALPDTQPPDSQVDGR